MTDPMDVMIYHFLCFKCVAVGKQHSMQIIQTLMSKCGNKAKHAGKIKLFLLTYGLRMNAI